MTRLLVFLALASAAYFLMLGPERALRSVVGRWLVAAITVVLALLYVRSPIDVIPDGTRAIGFLDDLVLVVYLAWKLRGRWTRRAPDEPRPARGEPTSPSNWDPYAVLGVARGASADEISAAYRRRMKEYHPDRVNDLGAELQRVAHEKTLEIQRAYEELRGG